MTRSLAIAAALVLFTGARAGADEPAPPALAIAAVAAPPTQVVSVPLWSLQQGQGIAVEYERKLPRPNLSVAGVAGVRDAADGDFQSIQLSLGGELRYWLRRDQMRGWYGGVALDLTRASVTDRIADRRIGSTLAIAESVSFGYRFVPWRRLELTPSVGLALSHEVDLDGRLPTWHRRTVTTGFTVGWMY